MNTIPKHEWTQARGKRSTRQPGAALRAGVGASIAGLLFLPTPAGCSEAPPEADVAPSESAASAGADLDLPGIEAADLEPRVAKLLAVHRDAVLEQPRSPEAWGAYAAALDAHELYPHAETAYRHARQLAPDDFRWTYLLATVAEIRGRDPENVQHWLETAATMEPGYATVHYRLGDVLARSGRTKAAADAYRATLDAAPDFLVARRELGQMLLRLDDPQEAREHLERVLAEAPDDRVTLSALVQATGQLGEQEASHDYASRVRSLDQAINVAEIGALRVPDPLRFQLEGVAVSSRACDERASRFMAAGDFAGAIENLKIVLERRPEDASAHLRLGTAYLSLGDAEAALTHLTRAVALDADSHTARLMLGGLLLAGSLPEQALPHLERAVELHPESIIGHTRRARACKELGRLEESVASYRRAMQLSPESAGLADELAEVEGQLRALAPNGAAP